MESARQKDITDITQLRVRTYIKDILIHFPLLKTVIIKSTCLKVKDLDLYIVKTACKCFQFSLIFFLIKRVLFY